ncbi:glycosyl transferase family 90 [Halomonas halodenitrificans]|uniref:glycosyl transferase family 90 n=1 Tax=Halomonas halodenitrificans TaxID=28252 RepID=UPI0005BD4FAF|nr:glycosyl transferase family 90 [Halomonas halodenitrificans]
MLSVSSRSHKNLHKLSFYSRHAARSLLPTAWFRSHRDSLLRHVERLDDVEKLALCHRVDFYNQCSFPFALPDAAPRIREFKREKSWAYYLDMVSLLRFFPEDFRFLYQFGDVTEVPELPTFLKSRPVAGDNRNSVLLKLNQVRHYYFVRDRIPFDAKLNKVVWRGACHQPHRRRFIEAFHNHSLCDVGDVHRKAEGKPWHREPMSVSEQLRYKYVLSIEGNDVATNLKWIMASNSLCFMTKPKYETWFMEGALVPDYHYVLVKDDYSDLEEKVSYYTSHPDEAKWVIHNANQYVLQFLDSRKELFVSLMVMKKYFESSGQC